MLKPGVKAGAVVAWLRADFGLGHGHAMAIVALLKARRSIAYLRNPARPDPSNSATYPRHRCKTREAPDRQKSRVAVCKTCEEGGRGARYILERRVKRLIHTEFPRNLQPSLLY
jgi:hypothetical protein